VLADIGCDVTVYERSPTTLEARGAGIAVLDDTERWFAEKTDVNPDDLCSSTAFIRFIDADGALVHERAHRYRFSSWNTMYRALLSHLPSERYLLGSEVVALEPAEDDVALVFESGARCRAELVVAADGISSGTRARLFPEARPRYSGYVAWRGTMPESDLRHATFTALSDAITFQVLTRSHALAYPIPGPSGSLKSGERLMNFVWYRNVREGAALDDLMTDQDGRCRPVSLPPGAARQEFVDQLRADARAHLAPVIAEVVLGVEEPFVQAVFDLEVPRMAQGRICLIGDAAFAVRPHAAAGTAKAAADSWELAGQLRAHGGAVQPALREWEQRQLTMGRNLLVRNREIGDASQRYATFTPGDPALIFGLRGPGN
jgi:2,6-dihydroxypyridine 3-monooxygenase